MNQALSEIITRLTWALAGAVGLILLGLAGLALFRPIILKLGLRNVPRRRSQAVLIMIGLTLSTIIIISALATGDTLQYSVRQHAIDAYGEIDEVLAPPLLSNLVSLTENQDSSGSASSVDDLARLLGGDDVFSLLDSGLPGIPMARYEELQQRAASEPLIDKLAPAIVFPTIIRNVSTGQGEPLGFIFAVNDEYDRQFGLHTVQGQPASIALLRPGAGNVFQLASDLVARAMKAASDIGLGPVKLSDVAKAAVGAASALSAEQPSGAVAEGSAAGQTPGPSLTASGTITGTQDAATATLAALLAQASGGPTAGTGTQAITRTHTLTATAGGPATTQAITSTQSLSDTAVGVLSGFNLFALRSELDRVLGEAGLELRQGDVYLSRLGAEKLDAHAGDLLEIYIGPIAMPFRVKGIVDEAGPLAALTPVVVMRLDEAQRLLFMQDKVNTILVSNAGDREGGISNTAAVGARLRLLALNDAALERVAGMLRGPAGQQAFAARLNSGLTTQQRSAAESNQALAFFARGVGSPGVPLDDRLVTLQRELSGPGDPATLRVLLADSEVRSWLQTLPLAEAEQAELRAALRAISEFEVIDLINKAMVVSVAEVGGGAFSAVFTICGTFSILAGVLLIFLIFVMLAAERKSELGMARAVGLQRGHLIQMFVAEGLVYDLFAAALGLGLGLLISYAMIGYLGGLFRQISAEFGSMAGVFRFYFHVTRPSLIIAYCLGVLLTFAVVVIASWRVSRLNIVAAIRDLGEQSDTRGEHPWLRAAGQILRGPLLLLAGLLLLVTSPRQERTLLLIGATLALVGAAYILDWALGRWTAMRPVVRARMIYSLIGCGLLALWGLPWDVVLPAAPASAGSASAGLTVLYFVLSAPLLILGAILLIVFNADSLAWVVSHLLAGTGALAPVLKTAIAYPLSARFRTGMAMLLFAMVITTVVVMSIVIQATETLVTPNAESTAGFDIVSQPTLLSALNPLREMSATLRSQTEAPLADIVGVGAVSNEAAEARPAASDNVENPAAVWGHVALIGLDDGYLAQAGTVYTFGRRAEGYVDDAAVWRALRERDDVAIITRELVDRATGEPGPVTAVSGDPDTGGLPALLLRGLDLNSAAPLPQLELELRPKQGPPSEAGKSDTGGAASQSVQVIGVYHQATNLAGSGLQLNRRAARNLTGKAEPYAYYVKVRPGADVKQVAQGLERALVPYGQNVMPLAETFSQGREIARGVLQLLQGFMALGLLVGIAALGVISSRTVVERRQQIGMLRAIGFQPGTVAFSFLLESSFIALSGIVIGTGVGVLLGRQMIAGVLSLVTPGQTIPLPWASIGGVLLLAYLFSLLTTLLPALQASRIYPAEALRYE